MNTQFPNNSDIPSVRIKQFQTQVLERYSQHKRDLPWRKTTDPYCILVSEVMLQQTQVPRVMQKYTVWMKKRPTVFDLANASRAEVLTERSGLGFNRRAINLHEACKKIAHDAVDLDTKKTPAENVLFLMADYAYIRSLPGVGDYTSGAILAFAYNMEVSVIDINIKRVIIHTFQLSSDISFFDLQAIALSLIPHGKSRDWYNALMDYGSQVLHSRVTGIRSAKQSQFQGSDRQVRGRILKQLAAGYVLTMQDVAQQRPEKDTNMIIAGLQKEGFIVIEKSILKHV